MVNNGCSNGRTESMTYAMNINGRHDSKQCQPAWPFMLHFSPLR